MTIVRRILAIDWYLIVILAAALGCRVVFASNIPFIHDEINNTIALARTISFSSPVNLPMRGENHGALPAYVAKASASLFGTSLLGYRALHVALGLLTIGLIYLTVRRWWGPVAARWAAVLLAFNEYYLPVSSRVTAQSPFLFLMALAVYAFSRFLAVQRASYLYGAGIALGLAFYCKEHAALLAPVFFLTLLLHPSYRSWLRRPQTYLAALAFTVVLAPDLVWNFTSDPQGKVYYGDQEALEAHYSNHLRRIGGLGFSPYPLMFYARSAVMPAYAAVTGTAPVDETREYPSINPALGVLLLAGVLASTLIRPGRDGLHVFLLLMFWCIFGLFSSIEKGRPPGRLDPVSWIWVEATMFPAVMLTGVRVATLPRWWRVLASLVLAAAVIYGLVQLAERFGSGVDALLAQRGAVMVVDVSTL